MKQIYLAVINVLKERNYSLIFVFITTVFLALFIYIPVVIIPGNDIGFQLSIFAKRDYIIMALLALLVGLNFSLQIYSFKRQKDQQDLLKSSSQVAVSGFSGVFGAIVGTAACASCLAFIFGLIGLGAGSVLFVLKHQSYFLGGSTLLMLLTLYLISRKVNGVCESCRVDKKSLK